MNIDHTKIDAAASARLSGRSNAVRRFVLAGAFALVGMPLAHAGGPGNGPGDKERDAPRVIVQERAAARAERQQAPVQQAARQEARVAEPRQAEPRQAEARSFEARSSDEQRRLQQVQQEQGNRAEAFRRSGRLTPDERRDLRRQINEAGLDIYPNTPRR